MAELIAREGAVAVVGLGMTGLSAVRFLRQLGYAVSAFEHNAAAPGVSIVRERFPEVPVYTGEFDVARLREASQVLLSPGVPRALPALQALIADGIPVEGDIAWFSRYALRPIIAVTGSNGKSTVVSWIAHVLQTSGITVQSGGNIGVPVLDLLSMPEPGVYVLELSSFQLESATGFAPTVASVLNVSPDHLDRYADLAAYTLAKQRIYRGTQQAVINRADVLTQGLFPSNVHVSSFGLDRPDMAQFGVVEDYGERFLCHGSTRLCLVSDLHLKGDHNVANALAVLAIVDAFGVPCETVIEALKTFKGLPHRCQVVGMFDGVVFYNDSKGTNVGATIAAINGLGPLHRVQEKPGLVLLLGGRGKGADFSALVPAVKEHVHAVVTFGESGMALADALSAVVSVSTVHTMAEALVVARAAVRAPGAVVLSPACASLDQFANYEARGDQFMALVAEQASETLAHPDHG